MAAGAGTTLPLAVGPGPGLLLSHDSDAIVAKRRGQGPQTLHHQSIHLTRIPGYSLVDYCAHGYPFVRWRMPPPGRTNNASLLSVVIFQGSPCPLSGGLECLCTIGLDRAGISQPAWLSIRYVRNTSVSRQSPCFHQIDSFSPSLVRWSSLNRCLSVPAMMLGSVKGPSRRHGRAIISQRPLTAIKGARHGAL